MCPFLVTSILLLACPVSVRDACDRVQPFAGPDGRREKSDFRHPFAFQDECIFARTGLEAKLRPMVKAYFQEQAPPN